MTALPRKSWFSKTMLRALITIAALCSTAQAADVVRIGGAGSGLGPLKILAAAFEKSHPGTTIKILPSLGSAGGIKALLHGAIDLAISGRALKTEEQKDGAAAVECARTPFVFVAHQNVTKTDVTTRELEMIYNGQTTTWPDGSRIRLILRPAGDTDTGIVKAISKGMEQAVNTANARQHMIVAVTDQEAADAVAKIPGALGGSTLAQVATEVRPLRVLTLNGIAPTLATLDNGRYPLSKQLYLVTAPNTPAVALQFVQFVRSAQGRTLLAKTGSLPSANDKRVK